MSQYDKLVDSEGEDRKGDHGKSRLLEENGHHRRAPGSDERREAKETPAPRPMLSSKTVFERTSIKYWIHPKDLPAVKEIIGAHMPIHRAFSKTDSQNVSSVYLDNDNLDFYDLRLRRVEGAQLIRLRWYQDIDRPKKIYVERKLHHESWVNDNSAKERFSLDDVQVLPFLHSARAGEEEKEQPNNPLVVAVREAVSVYQLKPCLRSVYVRTEYQFPDSDACRMTLDTNLRMIREQVNFDTTWYTPMDDLSPDSVHFFPMAVLEIKLAKHLLLKAPIPWLADFMRSDLIRPMDKFSKYCHGIAMQFPQHVSFLPPWIPEFTDWALQVFRWRMEGYFHEQRELAPPNEPGNDRKDAVIKMGHGVGGLNTSMVNMRDDDSKRRYPRGESILSTLICCKEQETLTEQEHRKLIYERMKIEPKTYFANERTFLQWFNAGVLVASIGLALIGLEQSHYAWQGYFLVAFAIFVLFYAMNQYRSRCDLLVLQRPGAQFVDKLGPVIITLVLTISLVLGSIFTNRNVQKAG